jgi:hypothetical protein
MKIILVVGVNILMICINVGGTKSLINSVFGVCTNDLQLGKAAILGRNVCHLYRSSIALTDTYIRLSEGIQISSGIYFHEAN